MSELIAYQLAYDANRKPHGQIVAPSKHVDAYLLSGTAKAITIPTGAKFAMFSCADNFYINFAGTAVIPVGDVTNGSASELNPTVRNVDGYTSFSAIASSSCILTVAYYK
jgi:hypothetical protein